MPRSRTPVQKATVSGAVVKDPKRYRDRKEAILAKLGGAPRWFDRLQGQAWNSFTRELPWLTESDRAIMEVVAPIRAAMRAGEPVGITRLNLYRLCLAQLGASPADRSKVSLPPESEDDEDAEFYQ